MTRRLLPRARAVRLAIFDVDGVLTDGVLYLSERGEAFKAFHILDGQGLKMLRASGVELALLSGRKSAAVLKRATEVGVDHVVQGAQDKLRAFRMLLRKAGLTETEAAFMGDDLPDLPVLRCCGFAISVPGAPALVQRHAHYVTRRPGGFGAVREACELLMQAQGTLSRQLEAYLR
ncbi:MAG TPA: HAD-IIIA family hydrolase [Burkholderiales bacterium]|jgi:3-deoxy-D-manno-octulosonate 8-phosphate phosphatase (KDO 8-P phosphatase)|nr:HAD-IIIA family hydrolase [Burkholderiales bacterium]